MKFSLNKNMKYKFSFFSILGLLILLGFSVSAKAQESAVVNPPNCKVIRIVPYPVTQKMDKTVKNRIALLDLCPANRGMAARPMLPLEVNGKMQMFEYDVVRVFKNRKEAARYAKANDIKDANF